MAPPFVGGQTFSVYQFTQILFLRAPILAEIANNFEDRETRETRETLIEL